MTRPAGSTTAKTRTRILSLMRKADDVTNQELADLLDMSAATIYHHLSRLRADSAVEMVDRGKNARWRAV
jgi:predicted ArsR family transcriptional regulator